MNRYLREQAAHHGVASGTWEAQWLPGGAYYSGLRSRYEAIRLLAGWLRAPRILSGECPDGWDADRVREAFCVSDDGIAEYECAFADSWIDTVRAHLERVARGEA